MLDAVVTGAQVVTGGRVAPVTLGIQGGRIALLAEPGVSVSAREVVDASGCVILPGLVDAHVHLREPGFSHKEGFQTGTMAAAAGGVTTVMVMPTTSPATVTVADFEDKLRLAHGSAYVDFAIQAALTTDLSQVEALSALGVVSFELFLGDVPPHLTVRDNGVLLAALEAVARVRSVAGVTPGDDGVVGAMQTRLDAARDRSPRAFARSRPPIAEALGVARATLLAAQTGARMHLRQISCQASVEVLRVARARSAGLSAEVTPHNLLLTEDELDRQGPFAKVTPPLRSAADLEAVWAALRDGTIDIVATDHAPHLPEEKEAGRTDIWKAPSGLPGLQTVLPLMLAEVARGRLTLVDLALLCAERPARLFGLYPQKGALQLDSDADFVIIEPEREVTIENGAQLSRARVTPFAGRRVRGWPVATFVRGNLVMREGKVVGPRQGALVTPRR